ncbi:hypothetical protein P879_09830, partial [Paragonimus westermani]
FSVPYRSTLVRFTSRLLLLPLHITRVVDEELHILVELASGYQDYQDPPIVRGRVTMESRELIWTRASIRLDAHLTGFRSWLYYWPWFTCFVLTSSSFIFVNTLYLLMVISQTFWPLLSLSSDEPAPRTVRRRPLVSCPPSESLGEPVESINPYNVPPDAQTDLMEPN